MKILLVLSIFVMISVAYAQTPFRDTSGLTINGIEWCEENYQLYKFMGNGFFEHHKHSIEARICGNLYNDELWFYTGHDRYQKLVEQSRIYYNLEIQESLNEAKEGKVDTKPASVNEIPQEIAQQQKEIEIEKINENEKDIEIEKINENEKDIEIEKINENEKDIEIEKINENEKDIKIISTNTENFENGGCLIATATFGSELAPQVQQLREIRDSTLLSTTSGTVFMAGFNQFYYSFSSTISDWERESPDFKEFVKIIITPMLSTLSVMEYAGNESEVLGIGISVILMNIGIYFAIPITIVYSIRKLDFMKFIKLVWH